MESSLWSKHKALAKAGAFLLRGRGIVRGLASAGMLLRDNVIRESVCWFCDTLCPKGSDDGHLLSKIAL
jgi:hypothetical protein